MSDRKLTAAPQPAQTRERPSAEWYRRKIMQGDDVEAMAGPLPVFYVCSNPNARHRHGADPMGHCPDCVAQGLGNWSCTPEATPQPAAAQGWVILPRKEWGRLSEAMDYLKRDCADIWWSNFHAARVACQLAAAPQPQEAPVPVRIDCPQCTAPHVDEGEWATRPHKTHQCQACGHEWRPFPYATVGTPPAQATVKESLTVHPARGDGEGDHRGDFYGNGSSLPTLHPDPLTNAEILIQSLCARLDTARQALADAASMQVAQPVLQRIKANAAWAINETAPGRMEPRSAKWNLTTRPTPDADARDGHG